MHLLGHFSPLSPELQMYQTRLAEIYKKRGVSGMSQVGDSIVQHGNIVSNSQGSSNGTSRHTVFAHIQRGNLVQWLAESVILGLATTVL